MKTHPAHALAAAPVETESPMPPADSPWRLTWTKNGTPCMARDIELLNSPVVSVDSLEQHGLDHQPSAA